MTRARWAHGILLLALATLPRVSAGHAVPVGANPAADASAPGAPSEVTIRYSERVDAGASSLQVLDAQGRRVDRDDARVDAADPWLYRVGVMALPDGTYTVSWRVLSADDGHVTEGAHAFAIGATASVRGDARVVTARSSLRALGRWLGILGASVVLGGLVAARVLGGPEMRPAFLGAALAATLAGPVVAALGQAWELGGDDLGTGLTRLGASAPGRLLGGQAGLAVALGGLLVATRGRGAVRPGTRWSGVTLSLAFLALGGLTSHAAAVPTWRGLAMSAELVHVAAVSVWVGGLVAFATLVGRMLGRDGGTLVGAVPAFSLLATLAVGVLALSGIYLARVQLADPAALVGTAYGRVLLAKLLVVAVVLGLGAYHRFVIQRRLLAAGASAPVAAAIGRRFRRTLRLEALLGVVALLLGAVLAATAPHDAPQRPVPHPVEDAGWRHARQVEEVGLVLEIVPLRPGPNTIRVSVTDPHGHALGDATAALLRLVPEDAAARPMALALEPDGPGRFVKPGALLGIAGAWRGRLTVQRRGAYDVNERIEFVLPAPVRDAGTSSALGSRSAPLDLAMALTAAAVLALTACLAVTATRTVARARTIKLPDRVSGEAPDRR